MKLVVPRADSLVVDPKTGRASREWHSFFRGLQSLIDITLVHPVVHDNDWHDPDYATESAFNSHVAATTSVHNFDASGDAPAQAHDNTRHTEAYALDSDFDTHVGLTTSVHNFDASGDAPAQTHGNERHSETYATTSELTTALADYQLRSEKDQASGYVGLNGDSIATMDGLAIGLSPGSMVAEYLETPASIGNSQAIFGPLEIQGFSVDSSWYGLNCYYDSGFYRRDDGYAGLWDFFVDSGNLVMQMQLAGYDVAASAIPTWTTPFQATTEGYTYHNGNALFGRAYSSGIKPQKAIHVAGTGEGSAVFTNDTTGHGAGAGLFVGINNAALNATIYNYGAGYLRLATDSTEIIRLMATHEIKLPLVTASRALGLDADQYIIAGSHSIADIDAHVDDTTGNPHSVTYTQVGADAAGTAASLVSALEGSLGEAAYADFGTGLGDACEGNDARLSDARTPTAHASTHDSGGADAMAIDAVAGTGSLRTLGTSATSACAGNDSRLSDSRTPTAHASSHNAGGGDEMAIDAVAGTGSLRTLGTSATSACAGDDSRLSDARAPTAHASSHQHGGSDEIATATPGANAIPKADGSGLLDAWITPVLTNPMTTAGDIIYGGVSPAGTPTRLAASDGWLKSTSGTPSWEAIGWSDVSKTGSSLADLATRSHTDLSDIGTNAHSSIDTFIASKAQASGLASLDGSSLVVQNPASAASAWAADKILLIDGSGYVDKFVTNSAQTVPQWIARDSGTGSEWGLQWLNSYIVRMMVAGSGYTWDFSNADGYLGCTGIDVDSATCGNSIVGDGIELNANGSGDRYALMDFHSDDTYTDYGLRVGRLNTGANTSSLFAHRGTGPIRILAEDAGSIQLETNSNTRLAVDSSGHTSFVATDLFAKIRDSRGTIVTGSNNGAAIYLGVSDASATAPTGAIEASWGGASNPQLGIGVVRDALGANMLFEYSSTVTKFRDGSTSWLTHTGGTGKTNWPLLTASTLIGLDASKDMESVAVSTTGAADSVVKTDGSGNITIAGFTISGLTATANADGELSLASAATGSYQPLNCLAAGITSGNYAYSTLGGKSGTDRIDVGYYYHMTEASRYGFIRLGADSTTEGLTYKPGGQLGVGCLPAGDGITIDAVTAKTALYADADKVVTSGEADAEAILTSGDITMYSASTWYDAVELTDLPAGKWALYGMGHVYNDNASATNISARIYHGSTSEVEPSQYAIAYSHTTLSMHALIDLASATTIKLQCWSSVSGPLIQGASSTTPRSTRLTAVYRGPH